MKIIDVILSDGKTGFYFDDQRAIKAGAAHDGFNYVGTPVTSGFRAIRQAGESISVQLVLEDGQVAYGDCAAVQYSGAGGRDPLFLANEFIPLLEEHVVPWLIGRELTTFKELAKEMEALTWKGKPLHTAIRYGISQALLDAVAKKQHCTMAEVIRDEYQTGIAKFHRIPIFTQSGDDRYNNVDKMIIKGAEVIPHGLINNVQEKLGERGELLRDYIAWLRDRSLSLGEQAYQPILHLDVYGTIGTIFNQNIEAMGAYIMDLEQVAKPLHLRIEGPMDVEDHDRQIDALAALTAYLDANSSSVELVADEWCNTLEDIKEFADRKAGHMIQIKTPDLGSVHNVAEAILYCKEKGIGAYCGGTCNETDRSAQVTTQIAIACEAVQCLAKPGMGVDEGYMIVNNEMNRVIALANRPRKY